MKIIDKTSGLRLYTGGLYIFLLRYNSGEEKTIRSQKKLAYKGFINKDIEQITIDLL
jgi:hypothetical protein